MKPNPIEVVVIRPVVLALPAPVCPEPIDGLSADQQRDAAALLETLHCPVRQSILLHLAVGGPGSHGAGRSCVAALAERLGMGVGRVSNHLRPLRMRGLVHDERAGKQVCYTAAPGRVRLTRCADGGFALTLFTAAGERGVSVTLTVPGENSESG